jgi:hypothetical protein
MLDCIIEHDGCTCEHTALIFYCYFSVQAWDNSAYTYTYVPTTNTLLWTIRNQCIPDTDDASVALTVALLAERRRRLAAQSESSSNGADRATEIQIHRAIRFNMMGLPAAMTQPTLTNVASFLNRFDQICEHLSRPGPLWMFQDLGCID